MSASGGSLSDTNVSTNKVVDGKSHYLAYITPDEGKSLQQQGGKETITDSGIPAYPPPGEEGGGGYMGSESDETRDVTSEYTGGGGDPQTNGWTKPSSRQPGLETSTSVAQQTALQEDIRSQETETQEDNLIDQFKSGVIDKATTIKSALRLGLTHSKKLADVLGITSIFSLAMGAGGKVQQKAITWDLERRLEKEYKIEDDPRYRTGKSDIIQDKIRRAKLDPDDPDHYSQTDWTRDYGKDLSAPDDGGGNARGLTNVITPYAAHAIGGTTQQPSMAAQWYANLGSGNTNPGAFNLTQQYAKAKADVSQRLKSTSSIGQIAVADSAFFNFLKDNSLNKGIL